MYRVFSWTACRRALTVLLAVVLAACAVGEGAFSLSRRVTAAAGNARTAVLPVIMYHGLLPDKGRQNTYVIDPALLESDLQEVARRGYTTVSLQQVLDFVEQGTSLPEQAVLLTFDDGYYNNYRYAYPLLQQYGMKAVISPIVRWSTFYSDTPGEQDRPVYSHITWAQIREMADSGLVEFANHSYDLHHAGDGGRHGAKKLPGESVQRYQTVLREDLQKAQDLLTEKTGLTPVAFTYPFGAVSKEALPVLKNMGFRATFVCEERVNMLTADPACLYDLGRYLRDQKEDSTAFFDRVFRAAQAAQTIN